MKGDLKPVVWIGSCRESLQAFPPQVRSDIGHALYAAQKGETDPAAKPLKGFGGASVMEIIDRHDTNTYRTVYTVRYAGAVYVLHAFQKKSKRGIATPQKDTVGQEKPDTGTVQIGSTVKMAYVDQNRENLATDISLLDEVGGGAAEIVIGKNSIPVRQYLSRFGFKGSDQQKMAGELSGGERNRAHLAKLLKVGGNVLLLDEPTNDLDVNTLRMLEEAILDFAGTVLVISHDRYFLDRVCTHLLVFEGEGKLRWYVGNFREYEEMRIKETGGHQFENRRLRYRKLVKA